MMIMFRKRPVVIPAQAGIHGNQIGNWIPAFAGMTYSGISKVQHHRP